jgi:hypothetical protein
MDQPNIDKTRKSADIDRAERERVSRNLWKVYNPTNQDYQVVLNAAISPEIWTIKAESEEIVPWYVAEKYREEMVQKIITDKVDKAVIARNEERLAKGFQKMDLHTEQFNYERLELKKLSGKREKIGKILIRGIYKEYGVEKGNTQEIDKRQRREEFNPGDIFDEPEVKAEAPQPATSSSVPTQTENSAEPVDTPIVVEEPDEDAQVVTI